MSIITKSTVARAVKTNNTKKIVYAYAFILIVFVLCQLFTYDGFIRLLNSFGLPNGDPTSRILGSVIVMCELFALPFLLRMRLSSLMRTISMVLSWLVPLIWLSLSIWINFTVNAVSNAGFLGTIIKILPGWWMVYVSAALAILAIWSSWGLWPIVSHTKSK